MASATLIPVSEYLRSSYHPDADYVDGKIEERFLGERDHSDLQWRLLSLLNTPGFGTLFQARSELRVQTGEYRFRVPDVCLLGAGVPREKIVRTPPLLCMEILSPEDTMPRTMIRVRDFLRMGVPTVWIVDPGSRQVHVCEGDTVTVLSKGELDLPSTSIRLNIQQIFCILDED